MVFIVNPQHQYQCPVCSLSLTLIEKTWRCPQNHCFDRHKKGYVNLLLAHQKRSKQPGDDVLMVNSRRDFLNSGHYTNLSDQLNSLCQKHLPENAIIWDAGCGEGYYTHRLADAMPLATLYGVDISKPAIESACRYKTVNWSVASSTHPPFLNEQFDAIISVFSRVDHQPFARVLKPKGQVFMVVPGTHHLIKLRELIYETVRPYNVEKHAHYLQQPFQLIETHDVEFDLQLTTKESIQHLLAMTPHAHRMPVHVQQAVESLEELHDKASFRIYRFQLSD